MDFVKKGWFSEKNELWPGQFLSLEVNQILYEDKSEYQDILVFQSKHHGNVLVLDGIIQCTEHDEFAYQEMIAFLPLCVHPKPSKVLIVGGGDGGVAREVQKHPLVDEFIQVEIDGKVIDASKQHLPFMAKGFNSNKLQLKICDGFEYMKNHKHEFDVIITDSSDPIGPAVNLFTENYFKLLKEALRPHGVICSQAGTVWAGLDHVKLTIQHCKKHFGSVQYSVASVPTYPTGQIGFIVASIDENVHLNIPKHKFNSSQLDEMQLKYYNSDIHTASFVLPNFVRKVLG